jgi:hypothetical protein
MGILLQNTPTGFLIFYQNHSIINYYEHNGVIQESMTIDTFLMSSDVKVVSLLFLLLLLTIINLSWVFLFVISIRSYLLTPSITLRQYSKCRLSNNLPFVSVVVPARNEQIILKDVFFHCLLKAIQILK